MCVWGGDCGLICALCVCVVLVCVFIHVFLCAFDVDASVNLHMLSIFVNLCTVHAFVLRCEPRYMLSG